MADENPTRLEELNGGFRERFLLYDELTTQVRAWADAFPDLVRLESLATTPEGREMWLLTLGFEPDRARPAAWIDGNMHASELCGSSVALAVAEDVLRLHLAPDEELRGLPEHVREVLRGVLFHVLPRMSPDGAEAVLTTGRYVRSVPRRERPDRQRPRWKAGDVDGDGLALVMRKEDPTGEYVESPDFEGLLVPRGLDDPPPYYKLYPEGHVEGFDGVHVPTPSHVDDNQPDLNRNFPWSWVPDHLQIGAGDHPTSEVESRAVVEFAARTPHLFAWINFHTFGGVFIRPRGDLPDTKMDPEDLALYKQLGRWAEDITGYPMVSGFEEFTYEPDEPIRGDLSEWAYGHRGCVAYVCELWDLFAQLGLEKPKRFVDHYTRLSEQDLVALARWDAGHNRGRVFRPWKKVEHPQLGEVEVGGIDARVGISNPPLERIGEVCAQQATMTLRVAALAPRLQCSAVETTPLADGLTRVAVDVANVGYLPTYVLSSSRGLTWNEPLWAEAAADGCELADPDASRQELGHLDGWGRGLHSGSSAIFFMRSRGSTGRARAQWVVRGSGKLRVRAGSCRVGWIDETIEV